MAASKQIIGLEPPLIGAIWTGQGGRLSALMRGMNGEPDYYLIVPDKTHAGVGIEHGGYGKDIRGTSCASDGLANTLALLESKTAHPAANYAIGIMMDGWDDYYLPSRREARAIWCNTPELLPEGWIWTSTQDSAYYAWMQYADGGQHWGSKDYKGAVLPVRRLSVIQ